MNDSMTKIIPGHSARISSSSKLYLNLLISYSPPCESALVGLKNDEG